MWSDKEAESRDVLQVTAHLTLTVTPHLTLKMTAAEAVETSVTTINSPSQDFTNLDDQPSQTLTDTPVFKPFTLYVLYFACTNDETNYCRTVDKLIRCDNCSSFKTGVRDPKCKAVYSVKLCTGQKCAVFSICANGMRRKFCTTCPRLLC